MPSLLSSTLAQTARNQPFLLLQSSASQTCLPVLRALAQQARETTREATVLCCLLYPPSSFLGPSRVLPSHIKVLDRTGHVPGYDEPEADQDHVNALKSKIFEAVGNSQSLHPCTSAATKDSACFVAVPEGAVNVIIDSVDTLLSDAGSLSRVTQFLSGLLSLIRSRGEPSRLILHACAPSPLLPILIQTRFSPSLTHFTAHPPALLTHLSTAYLTPPPPLSPEEKFWGVFIPIAERHYESEKLVFGAGGAGSGSPSEFVVEVLVRGGVDGPGSAGRRRGVDRVLEGWSAAAGGPCELRELESLKALWAKKLVFETQSAPDPTQNLSFNLNLTPEQQRSRAQIPLPYAHENKSLNTTQTPAAILYDPDSADDLDDDDPDEDLDI